MGVPFRNTQTMDSPSWGMINVPDDSDEEERIITDCPSSGDEDKTQWLHGSASDTLLKAKCSSNLDAGETMDSPSWGMINVPDEEERIITDCPSLEDEEVKWWQRRSDSDTLLKGKYSFDLDSEEEDKMEAFGQSKTNFDDTFSDRVRDYCHYQTDDELLCFGPYSWRTEDTWNQREVYCITVYGEAPRKESRCLELLSVIGCEDRYLGCSVEMNRSFFANLNKNEADKMKGLEGVQVVTANSDCMVVVM